MLWEMHRAMIDYQSNLRQESEVRPINLRLAARKE